MSKVHKLETIPEKTIKTIRIANMRYSNEDAATPTVTQGTYYNDDNSFTSSFSYLPSVN